LANRFIETTRLSSSRDTLEHNLKLARSFVGELDAAGFHSDSGSKQGRGYLHRKVPVAFVRNFLMGFRNDRIDPITDPVLVGRYLDERIETELGEWDVLIASVNDQDADLQSNVLGPTLGQAVRGVSSAELAKGILAISGSSRRLGSPGDEKVGVDPEKAAAALEDFRKDKQSRNEEMPTTIPDRIYRTVRDYPLLILRLVRVKSEVIGQKVPTEPVVAWSISFPVSELNGGRVEYVVNTIKMRELFGEEDDEEEEVAGDVA
jgi:hypothetical protein